MMGTPLSGFSSLFEICFAINVGYSTIVTLRREGLAFFDTVDELSRKGLISGAVQFAAFEIIPPLRRMTSLINIASLPFMLAAAIAALGFLFYGSTNPLALVTGGEAAGVIGIMLTPSILSIALTTLATRNCRRVLIDVISKYDSKPFLVKLEAFIRSDDYAVERITHDLIDSWRSKDTAEGNHQKGSIRWWQLFLPWSLR